MQRQREIVGDRETETEKVNETERATDLKQVAYKTI